MYEKVIDRRVAWSETLRVQPPVQIRLLIEGEIEATRLRAVLQKIAERSCRPEPSQHTNGNGNGSRNGNGNGSGGKGGRIPWQEHDLRSLPKEQARKWITSFLETDGLQGISGERFPQMRWALLLTGKTEYELVWSLHPALRERVDVQRGIAELQAVCQSEVRIIDVPTQRTVETERQAEVEAPIQATQDEAIQEDGAEKELIVIWETVLNTTLTWAGIRCWQRACLRESRIRSELNCRLLPCWKRRRYAARRSWSENIEERPAQKITARGHTQLHGNCRFSFLGAILHSGRSRND